MFTKIDQAIVNFLRKIWQSLAKVSIFIIFFYFGFLKVIGLSPANPLVDALLQRTISFIPFEQFVILWGFFEMLIGLTFIIPKLERIAIFLLLIHMFIVALPLLLLPQITWQKFLVPTLEGQYIIKNLAIIVLALAIGAHLGKKD